ncbi:MULTISPECIES: outer membrane beta-barrel protein [Bradyrhizobium]|jgi:outer membrane immunogenic protein|uniref:Outer membrane beta-barrel protein n=3 Tax=Bradyrhizobium barranii TaxID=2992140 RepID=A0A7Z0QL51_9BRAD|nr:MULTISPECIES: outer membrane beta-barrel protein [Bradyrhizobium]MCK1275636.1 porin family protein [Bradyrhizobium sp. 61]MCK1442873.1 porin family protein [Bradyrhizobium sp. 48]MCK1460350.1 porin family protein [Bradyrhizobium sp. 2]TFW63112.1 porin family protein [Bradyrhizobium sp. MOS001]UEM08851.1 outer membrane beta-barrel protein [Bradyrhizobium barranii subsp. barranii]
MNKNLLLAAVSLVALSATAPALAADLAARPYTKAPAMIATVYDWSGFYIGINGGGGSSHATWDFVGVGREGSHDATGGTVGGQIGYRWQSGQWVFGVEGQGNWADFSGDNTSALFATRNRTKIDAFGLITGQVGYAWNNVLVYVKGGAAVVSNKYEISSTAGALLSSSSDSRWGGTVGAGLEYGFAPNWSVGVEYNHIFLSDKDVTFAGFAGSERIRQDVDMGLVRLNYKFGGPMIGRY